MNLKLLGTSDVPEFLKAHTGFAVSSLFVLDEQVPVIPFVQALTEAGYYVINLRDGRLVITKRPHEFHRLLTSGESSHE